MGGMVRVGMGVGQQGQKQMIGSRIEHGMRNGQGVWFMTKAMDYERERGMWHGTGQCLKDPATGLKLL